MRSSAKRDAKKADRAELARKALELRRDHATHDQIAAKLHLSNRSHSWQLVQSALLQIIEEPAREVLKLELDRLDAMASGCWAKAKSGDTAAIDRVLKIMDRRAAYLGLEAPKRTEHTGANGGPIRVTNLSGLTDEQIEAIANAGRDELPRLLADAGLGGAGDPPKESGEGPVE